MGSKALTAAWAYAQFTSGVKTKITKIGMKIDGKHKKRGPEFIAFLNKIQDGTINTFIISLTRSFTFFFDK
ncbi:MAG: hypothetical protein GY941_13210 [Planctomycetes bacterium]|nr:hypothetical protein [Planctomycetota bacterium]